MHKRLFNEAIIDLTLSPSGPILIKAGASGADPTRPDMEFVRTWRGGKTTVYLPGSSLKGVLRSHCERIARSLATGRDGLAFACDPLDARASCSERLNRRSRDLNRDLSGQEAHAESCFICQLFGNTSLASHLRIEDAYPAASPRLEPRNGVAIDRVFGSVAVGPFNFETVTEGEFPTCIQVKNFTLAQLGLLALAIRDLQAGRIGLGFGKSRGLGQVTARVTRFTARYPARRPSDLGRLSGVTDTNFLGSDEAVNYGYTRGGARAAYALSNRALDTAPLPDGLRLAEDDWGTTELTVQDEAQVMAVWRACLPAWRDVAGIGG